MSIEKKAKAMLLGKDRSPGGFAIDVPCVDPLHEGRPLFTLAYGYSDMNGRPFKDYYCDKCAERWIRMGAKVA